MNKTCEKCKGKGKLRAWLIFEKRCIPCKGQGTIEVPDPVRPEPPKPQPRPYFPPEPPRREFMSADIPRSIPTRNPYYGQKGGSAPEPSRSHHQPRPSYPSYGSSYRPSSGYSSGSSNTHVERETIYEETIIETHHHHHNHRDDDNDNRRNSEPDPTPSYSPSYDGGSDSGSDSGGGGGSDD